MIRPEYQLEWEKDCMEWRGVILTGKFSYWCGDWDGLPVDETSNEWPCNCYSEEEREERK
jgi:hypothetical protein